MVAGSGCFTKYYVLRIRPQTPQQRNNRADVECPEPERHYIHPKQSMLQHGLSGLEVFSIISNANI